jgi:hypothetical protein
VVHTEVETTIENTSEAALEVETNPLGPKEAVEVEEVHQKEALSGVTEELLGEIEAASEGKEAAIEGTEAATEGTEAASEVEEPMMTKKRSRLRFTSRDLAEVIQNEN